MDVERRMEMKLRSLLFVAFVFIVLCGAVWRLSFEKSGLIYYPESGAELVALSAKIDSNGYPATAKLINIGSGVSTPYYISSGATLSDLMTLEFENGAMLVPDSGVTIFVYSADNIICTETQTIKSGAGELHFTSGEGMITIMNYGGVNDGVTTGQNIAIDQAFNSGCLDILINEGSFLINTPTIIRNDTVTVRGIGDGSVIKWDADYSGTTSGTVGGVTGWTGYTSGRPGIINVAGDGCIIKDLFIDQNFRGTGIAEGAVTEGDERIHGIALGGNAFGVTNKGEDCLVENVFVYDIFGDGIYDFGESSDRARITHNKIWTTSYVQDWGTVSGGRQCISINGDGWEVSHNKIQEALDDAITAQQSSNFSIESNYVTTTGGRVLCNESANGKIINNTIIAVDDASSLIYLSHSVQGSVYTPSDGILVDGNTMYVVAGKDVGQAIDYFGGGYNVTIQNNTMETIDEAGVGIQVRDRIGTGFQAPFEHLNGVSIGGGNLVIKNNTINGFSTGLNTSSLSKIGGTAQAGGNTTITLEAGSAVTDQFYIYYTVMAFTSGTTKAPEYREITDYDGTTKIATIDSAWNNNPTASTEYTMSSLGYATYDENHFIDCGRGFNVTWPYSSIGLNYYSSGVTPTTDNRDYKEYFKTSGVKREFFVVSGIADFSAWYYTHWNGGSRRWLTFDDKWVISIRGAFDLPPDQDLDFSLLNVTTSDTYLTGTIDASENLTEFSFGPFYVPESNEERLTVRIKDDSAANTAEVSGSIMIEYVDWSRK